MPASVRDAVDVRDARTAGAESARCRDADGGTGGGQRITSSRGLEQREVASLPLGAAPAWAAFPSAAGAVVVPL